MGGSIYITAEGSLVQQKRLEVLANNIANLNTVGFKEERTSFQISDVKDSIKENNTAVLPEGKSQNLLSSLPFRTFTNFSPGQQKFTGNTLDMSLVGDGFFCIETPEGIRYSRKGNFSLNSKGALVTQEGFPVLGDGGKVIIDGKNVIIDEQGNISGNGNQANTIKIVDFPKPYVLEKAGNTLFALADSTISEERAENVTIRQGFIEGSNVNAIWSMTEMIETLRGYEAYQKVLKSHDEATGKAINDVGRLA